jgi:hypothetical protein
LGKWMQKATWFHQFSSISSFFLLFTMENMNVGLQRCYFVGPQNLCRKHLRSRNEETYSHHNRIHATASKRIPFVLSAEYKAGSGYILFSYILVYSCPVAQQATVVLPSETGQHC